MNKLAILVAGGPAPGINSVIGAATIRARLEGIDVIGIRDGFTWIMDGDIDHVVPLTIDTVSRIHFRGGSYLGIARANPTKDPALLDKTIDSLTRLGVSQLITIGGDDTAFSAMKLEARAAGRIRVVHVPKTIDNDLDLPPHVDTFGFQSARHYGVDIVKNLMVDAKTTSRWYFVIAMGRKAGHLALGIGKAAGATTTLITEEFTPPIRMKTIVDSLVGIDSQASRRRPPRRRRGHRRGRGARHRARRIWRAWPAPSVTRTVTCAWPRSISARSSRRRSRCDCSSSASRRRSPRRTSATSCAAPIPIPIDMEYTRDLGYCAAKFLVSGGNAAMVSMQGGHFVPVPFATMIDSETGRTRVRLVDIASTRYAIARRYMIRLRKDDFEDTQELARLARTVKLTPEEFRKEFEYLVAHEPPPLFVDQQGEKGN